MLDKINISNIVRDHFRTHVNANTDRFGPTDLMITIIIPAGISYFITAPGWFLSVNMITALIAALSIWVALLLNLLIIIFDTLIKLKESLLGKTQEVIMRIKLKRIFLNEIYANISFSILLSITSIIFLLFCLSDNKTVLYIFNFLSYYTLTLFLLTLLMVLKRVHVLLTREFED